MQLHNKNPFSFIPETILQEMNRIFKQIQYAEEKLLNEHRAKMRLKSA